MKNKFKKGEVLFYWKEGGHTDEITLVLEVKKLSTGKYYYTCLFPDNAIETIGESWLYRLEEHYKSKYIDNII